MDSGDKLFQNPPPQEVPGLTSLNREDSRDVIRNHFAFPAVSEQITLGEVFHRMGTYFPQFRSLGDPRSSDRQIWDLVRAPCLL